MPVRGAGGQLIDRWAFGARWIEGIPAERARQRVTLSYSVTSAVRLGVEVNPRAPKSEDRVGPIANWRIVEETKSRPAVIIGTSSDRIGTEEGQAYFATLSKSLKPWLDLPIAPYVGASWNDRDHEWLGVGGLNYRLYDKVSVTHLWDGRNLHHTFDVSLGDLPFGEEPFGSHNLGAILAEQDGKYYFGLSYSVRF